MQLPDPVHVTTSFGRTKANISQPSAFVRSENCNLGCTHHEPCFRIRRPDDFLKSFPIMRIVSPLLILQWPMYRQANVGMTEKVGSGQFGKSKATRASIELMNVNLDNKLSTPFTRLSAQEPQCWMGEEGVCCRVCYMGPCRILGVRAKGGATQGVCGATADTIVARNLIRETIGGTAAHTEHALEIAEALRDIAEGKLKDYGIKDPAKLSAVATNLGLATDARTDNEIAKDVARIAIEDIEKTGTEPMAFTKAYAPKSSYETWKKLGILPSGAMKPIVNGLH